MRTMLLTLLLAAPAFALDIPDEHREANIGGRCTWSCLQAAGRTHGIEPLKNLVQLRLERFGSHNPRGTSDPGYTRSVEVQLDALGIEYISQDDWRFDFGTLKKYAGSHGVVVTLKAGAPMPDGGKLVVPHSVLLCDFDDEKAVYYNPDRITSPGPRRLWSGSRAWFARWWSGNAIVVLGVKQQAPQGSAAFRDILTDRCEVLEINHVWSCDPEDEWWRYCFSQLIGWEVYRGEMRVVDWRIVKEHGPKVERDFARGDYVVLWHDEGRLREVRAPSYRETYTCYDVELAERVKLPVEKRRRLGK
jgi:hypothetical protein